MRTEFAFLKSTGRINGCDGEGEWKVKKHGADGRRTWRKLHLAVDPDTHTIVAQSLTENNVHDGDQVDPLLKQVESNIKTFYDDGAYDQWKVHNSLEEREIEAIIPPCTERVCRLPSPQLGRNRHVSHGKHLRQQPQKSEIVKPTHRSGAPM